jgi:hypothetical protein
MPSARRWKPSRRWRRSVEKASSPKSSDRVPDESLRASSIWKRRSEAWTHPSAKYMSASVRARIRGTPIASKVTSTGWAIAGTARVPS